MGNQLYKIVLLTFFSLASYIGFAQSIPTLEITNRLIAPSQGPTTNPITIPFENDASNNNIFSSYSPSLTLNVALRNQVYTDLPYSNISTGVVFGGAPTLSSDGPIQAINAVNTFDILGAYAYGAGGPRGYMFTSNPNATGTSLGTGIQFATSTSINGKNTGVEVFTAAQVLYDFGKAKDDRYFFGEIVLTFNRPVINPVIHVASLGGSYRYLPAGANNVPQNYLSSYFTTELELQNTGVSSTKLSGNQFLNVVGNNILNSAAKPNGASLFDNTNFFDDYGAATGSIKITGVVQQLVYKLFLRGSAASDINFSTLGSNVICDNGLPCTHNPFSGDQWYISASLDKPTQQISGNVFIDRDGLTDNDINKSLGVNNPKTNIGGALFANLLSLAGNVVSTTPVTPEGVYLFDNVASGVFYSVQLTTIPGTVGLPAPATVLPATWANTGEFIGNTVGNDAIVNGKSTSIFVNANDIKVEVNFGIEQLPESVSFTNFLPAVPLLNSTYTLNAPPLLEVLRGSDPEDMPASGSLIGKTFRIDILPTNVQLLYNGMAISPLVPIYNYDPALLKIKFISSSGISIDSTRFFYSYIDAAGLPDPTPAKYLLRWQSGQPVPIILSDFSATKNNCQANLNWKTASEIDSDKFDVEYSTNENTDFKRITSILAFGNSTVTKNYQFSFAMESNIVYYFRLKMINKDGSYKYSDIRKLSCINQKDLITVAPNVTANVFHITGMERGENKIYLYSNDGKLIRTQAVFNNIDIDVTDMSSGIYMAVIFNENGTRVSKKIIKY
jgi:hypothetical protein